MRMIIEGQGAKEGDVLMRADGKNATIRREGNDLVATFEDAPKIITERIQRKRHSLLQGIAKLRRQFK